MNFKYTSTLIILLIAVLSTNAQRHKYYDGPYIRTNDVSARIMWIEKGEKYDTVAQISDNYIFDKEGLPKVELSELSFEEDDFMRYDSVSKFTAISDIHGQYDLFMDLMRLHAVVDSSGNWAYGDGHLIIVGDMFDRGDKVTELLWKLFQLEKEAAIEGGKVHVLLGNHELMILHGDVRYINPKYRFTTGSFKVEYPELFDDQSVLGQWLRSKNVAAVVNNIGFVHGGFSESVLKKESSLNVINEVFKKEILTQTEIDDNVGGLVGALYFDNGPLWYRGYANPSGFDLDKAENILEQLDIQSIVVGHTSMPRIVPLHDNKIILIDSSIKFGKTGEVLIYERDTMYRGNMLGELTRLDAIGGNRSPFEYVHDQEDFELTIELDLDLDTLFKNKLKEEYLPATLLARHDEEYNRTWDVRVRARGNMRKQICHLPPLKIDFPKSTLDYLGFTKNDKLKVVLPCDKGKKYQQGLFKEYIIYQFYEALDSLAFQTRLVNFVIKDQGKEKYDLAGFIIEDDVDFAKRTESKIIYKGIVIDEAIDREAYLRMVFFQFMIMNNDFAIFNKHNMKIISHPSCERPIAIPYDFDYAGMVDQDYASSPSSLPIFSVREPFFRGKKVTMEEIAEVAEFYLSKESEIKTILEDANYLSKSSRKRLEKDIDRFYKLLKDESRWDTFIREKKK